MKATILAIWTKFNALKTSALGLGTTALAVGTSALTVSSGAVTFAPADSTALDNGVGNAISNLWAGFAFMLPYLGVFIGVSLVIGVVMSKVQRGH